MTAVVMWPAKFDKIDNAHETPLSGAALAALKAERARQGAIAGLDLLRAQWPRAARTWTILHVVEGRVR